MALLGCVAGSATGHADLAAAWTISASAMKATVRTLPMGIYVYRSALNSASTERAFYRMYASVRLDTHRPQSPTLPVYLFARMDATTGTASVQTNAFVMRATSWTKRTGVFPYVSNRAPVASVWHLVDAAVPRALVLARNLGMLVCRAVRNHARMAIV
uniref:Putative secreted protein n=1 Tax=Anopheles darlingi TaxID=43151 RepID=A0A2M4DRM7_ANODA